MALKYDFNISQQNNLFMDALIYVNDNTSNFLVYSIMLIIGFVALYVINKITDDSQLSIAYSMFICIILSIILYYGGLSIDAVLFSGNVLIALIFIEIGIVSLLFYSRNKLSGD